MLHYTMARFSEVQTAFYRDRVYRFFVCWLRDHTHVLKGMKYFAADLRSALELYRDSQRPDGMIWDNIYPRDKDLSYFEQVFRPGGFQMATADRRFEFRRIPVEADVEYLYIQGIYDTWWATGDDDWLAGMLDSAMRAMEYYLVSPYRWSQKYGLIKRGFTIDTWDFQSWLDVQRSGHIMTVDPEWTEFGVMHGDNTGFAQSCRLLARMLRRVGREEEARRFAALAEEIKARLDRVSWNGRFYTHHVPENPAVDRSALGGDLGNQLSLSNAYALNRGLTHEQCKAIIQEYQRIRQDLPPGAAGEWYTIYPPFERFNDGHSGKWEYMNAGIITIVAGELARGAFEHGFEEYGLDIWTGWQRWRKSMTDTCIVPTRGRSRPGRRRASARWTWRRTPTSTSIRSWGWRTTPPWNGWTNTTWRRVRSAGSNSAGCRSSWPTRRETVARASWPCPTPGRIITKA